MDQNEKLRRKGGMENEWLTVKCTIMIFNYNKVTTFD